MTISDMRQMRHKKERGEILRLLKEDFQVEMSSIHDMLGVLDAMNLALSQEDIEFHFTYLAGQGYVQIWRARDLPGYRTDRRSGAWIKPSTMLFAKLTPRGLQLIDGSIPADPQIRF